MRITASNTQILNEILEELEEQNISAKMVYAEVEGVKGDVATYISLAGLGVSMIGTLITYLTYLQNQKSAYIHYRYKDDVETEVQELKLNNLTPQQLEEKIKNIQDDFDKLELLDIGY